MEKLTKEEIKKAIASHILGFSLKSILESNDKIGDAYENGQKNDIRNAADEVCEEIAKMYNITEE